jgi:hypothetical protein
VSRHKGLLSVNMGRSFLGFRGLCCLLFGLVTSSFGQAPETPKVLEASAPTPGPSSVLPIEEQAYWVEFRIAYEAGLQLTAFAKERLQAQLRWAAWAALGEFWEVRVGPSQPGPVPSSPRWLQELDPQSYESLVQETDKIFFCHVRPEGGFFEVWLRELDLVFLQLGPVFRDRARELTQVPQVILSLSLQAFTPHGAVASATPREIWVRLRGAGRRILDPQLQVFTTGLVFRPYRSEPGQSSEQTRPLPIHWSYLVVRSVEGSQARCRLVTGVRGLPIPQPARDPSEIQLQGVKGSGEPTVLRVVSAADGQPAVALEVELRPLDSNLLVPMGTTDYEGKLVITDPPGRGSLVLIYLRQGRRPIAILPLLPGSGAVPSIEVPLDPLRVSFEGRLAALQDEVIDYVTERTVLANTLNSFIEQQRWKEAAQIVERLKSLPSQAEFLKKWELVEEAAKKLFGDARPMPASVRRSLDETRKLIERYVDPGVMKELLHEYESLRST